MVVELAARHHINADDLIEAWVARAAIREHLAGFSRHAAEVWAIGDVESMFKIGLHCPFTRQQMLSGGQRSRPPQPIQR
jgi:hypothetical protein